MDNDFDLPGRSTHVYTIPRVVSRLIASWDAYDCDCAGMRNRAAKTTRYSSVEDAILSLYTNHVVCKLMRNIFNGE